MAHFFTKNMAQIKLKAVWMLVFASTWLAAPAQKQVTGLNNWTIFIDQGHSQFENMGVFNYSEAEKVLRVGHALRDYLLNYTDIKAVYLARQTDQDNVTLTARVDQANTLGVDFYYSIHSDAGSPEVNSTLMLYGGWNSNGLTVEKTPQGGAAFGNLLNIDLTEAMRIPSRGNFADRIFYQGNINHHTNQFPFLFVNRVTQMASLLSEAGFHTNPTQNQRNMNAEWKKLEALAAFWSILGFHNTEKPAIGVATGFIRDIETLKPLNGIKVTIGNKVYITDTFQSLFHRFSNDPNQLSNGFYFIENLEPLSTVNVVFSSDKYQTHETSLVIASDPKKNILHNISFLDVLLTSTVPPVVESVETATPADNFVPGSKITIRFSRKMNQQNFINAINISPSANIDIWWADEFTLVVNTHHLAYLTNYIIEINGAVAQGSLTGQYLDGNGDGLEGGDFVFEVTTSAQDIIPPQLIEFSPSENEPSRVLRPIIRLVYDEPIIAEGIGPNTITIVPEGGGNNVQGSIHHTIVNARSVLHFFPSHDLNPSLSYSVKVAEGLADSRGNHTHAKTFKFYMINQPITHLTIIDSFDAGIVNWWHPHQAGQTTGIISEQTARSHDINLVNHTTSSTGSMRLNYAWAEGFDGTPYIRLHIPATASQNTIRFNSTDVLQVHVFGDGSGNQFRLMIRDGLNQLEGSEWFTLDWIGWKLVSWNLANDPVFGWVNGNGILEGQNFYIDGFHLRFTPGANTQGTIYFDDLRFVRRSAPQFPTALSESFEKFVDFSTDLFPWKTIDVQKGETVHPIGFTFPGAGTPFAFKVMHPGMTTEPIIDNHPPANGIKYLFAMASKTPPDNKWLISPQIRAANNTHLRFFARSISQQWGLERFRVLVLTDNNAVFDFNPGAFIQLSQNNYLEAPSTWTQFSYSLGSFAGQTIRVAIQYVSNDSYLFMLDHIEVKQMVAQITSITPVDNVSVTFGTTMANVLNELPLSTTITDSFGNTHLVSLTWIIDGYDPFKPGNYLATATFVLPVSVNQSTPPTPLIVTATVTVRPDATNIPHINSPGITLFPNPARNHINIFSGNIIIKAELHGMDGKLIWVNEPAEKQIRLNINGLDQGMYLMRILDNNGWSQIKFQKIN